MKNLDCDIKHFNIKNRPLCIAIVIGNVRLILMKMELFHEILERIHRLKPVPIGYD